MADRNRRPSSPPPAHLASLSFKTHYKPHYTAKQKKDIKEILNQLLKEEQPAGLKDNVGHNHGFRIEVNYQGRGDVDIKAIGEGLATKLQEQLLDTYTAAKKRPNLENHTKRDHKPNLIGTHYLYNATVSGN
ncbi:hypothetical protein Q8F55_006193 [Vanrija albida]|uniref:Uncharacterized protein n=1 Tax=Vanrija albida TaxID=181172 RepID=A0ABR3PWQ9_9TREE